MGKRTTTRHKEDNTFKFETFGEKLRRINVNISADYLGDLREGRLDTDSNNPYILRSVEKWSELDLSQSFNDLMADLGTDIRTLHQIIHHKDKLVGAIYNHICVKEKQSLPATFELATALSLDLERLFDNDRLKYVERIVEIVTELKDSDIIECAFKCLAHLLKQVTRELNSNFDKYILAVSSLLRDDAPIYLKVLGAHTLERLMLLKWKREGKDKFYKFAIHMLKKHHMSKDGMATVLSTMFRGPNGTLKLPAVEIVKETIEHCFKLGDGRDLWNDTMIIVIEKLTAGLSPSSFNIISTHLLDRFKEDVDSKQYLDVYIKLIHVVVLHAKEEIVESVKSNFESLNFHFEIIQTQQNMQHLLFEILKKFVTSSESIASIPHCTLTEFLHLKTLDSTYKEQLQDSLSKFDVIVLPDASSLEYPSNLRLMQMEPVGNELTKVHQICLELENMDFRKSFSYLPNMNVRMEKLITISGQSNQVINTFLMEFAFGMMQRNFIPLRKKCMTLIESCWENNHLDTLVLEHLLKYHNRRFPPPHSSVSLEEIDHSADSTADKQNLDDYLSDIWEIIARYSDISRIRAEVKTELRKLVDGMLEKYVHKPPFYDLKVDEDSKKLLPYLVSMMKWQGRFLKSLGHQMNDKYQYYLTSFLMSTSLPFRKAGMEAAYETTSGLGKYREQIESTMGENKIPNLTDFAVEAVEPIIKDSKDRHIVMTLILPIIAQKFLRSNNKKQRRRVQKPILIGLMGFKENEAKRFIRLVIGEENYLGFERLSFQNVGSRLRSIKQILDYWKHTFPKLVMLLVRYTVRFVQTTATLGEVKNENMVESFEDDLIDDELNDTPVLDEICELESTDEEKASIVNVSERRKIMAGAFSIICFVFENFPKLWSNDGVESDVTPETDHNTLQSVLETIVHPPLKNLSVASTGGNVNSSLKLLNLWSRVPRYRELLTVFTRSGSTPVEHLSELLVLKSVHVDVKVYLFKILLNLIRVDEEDTNESTLYGLDCLKFGDTNLPLGTNILLSYKNVLLALDEHINLSSLVKNTDMCEGYLKMMELIVAHSTEDEIGNSGAKLVKNILFRRLRENSLLQYLKMVRELVKKLPNKEDIIIHLSKHFRDITDRNQRIALVDALEGYEDVECKQAIADLNAFDATDLICPDYKKRQEALKTIDNILEIENFDLARFCLIGSSMVHILVHENQATTSNNALMIFEKMGTIIKSCNPNYKDIVNEFLQQVVLVPSLKTVVDRCPESFENRLRMLKCFVEHSSCFNHILTSLEFAARSENGESIMDGLCDIQVNNKIKSMNKLLKILEMQLQNDKDEKPIPSFGVKVLLEYILPMASYSFQMKKGGKMSGSGINSDSVTDNLIDSSVKVYRAAVQLLTPKQYISFLDKLLTKKPKDPSFIKRYKRQLLAVMNGFQYNLKRQDEIEGEIDNVEIEGEDSETRITDSISGYQISEEETESILNAFRPVLVKLRSHLSLDIHRGSDSHKGPTPEDTLKVECTIGLVKLLQKFPKNMARDIMNPFIPNACAEMKSKDHQKRRIGRNTLISLMKVMGVTEFPKVVKYLQANLKVGFQKHVLNNTIFTILSTCENLFTKLPNVIPIKTLVPLCEDEFFGTMNEEKAIGKIIEKTKEARTPNAENILKLCSKFVSNIDTLAVIINSGINHLQRKRSEKILSQVRKWIQAVEIGLSNNTIIPVEDLSGFFLSTKFENQNSSSSEPPTKRQKRGPSTYEMTKVLPKNVKDSLNSENDLFLTLSYKVVYNNFAKGNGTVKIAKAFSTSVVTNLSDKSKEVMLLSHRLLTFFLSIIEENIYPENDSLERIWRQLIQNVTKYCSSTTDDAAFYETINVIFTCIVTFLRVCRDWRIQKADFTLLITSIQSFISTGACVTPALQLLGGIVEKRVDEKIVHDVMSYVLKTATRSTASHIVEGCRKVYILYLMTYKTASKDCLSNQLSLMFKEYEKAEHAHEKSNIIDTIDKIVREVPESTCTTFIGQIPYITFKTQFSETEPVRASGIAMLNGFLSRPGFLSIILPFGDSLLNKKPQTYHPNVIFFLSIIFEACLKDYSNRNLKLEAFIDGFTKFLFELIQKEDEFEDGMSQAFFEIRDIVENYLKRNKRWVPDGLLEVKWAELMRLVCLKRMDYYLPSAKLVAVEIFSTLMRHSDWDSSTSGILNHTDDIFETPLPFMQSAESVGILIKKHLDVLKSNTLFKTKEVAGENLILLLQFICKYTSTEVDSSDRPLEKSLAHILLCRMKLIINREVTQTPNEYAMREVGYKVFKAYIHLADTFKVKNRNTAYEHRKKLMPEEVINSTDFMNNIRIIVKPALRDSTDTNVSDLVKQMATDVLTLMSNRIGENVFQPIKLEVLNILHLARRKNKAKKAQTKVLHPGIKRKRLQSTSGKGPMKKKK